jgi:hypothetical protein
MPTPDFLDGTSTTFLADHADVDPQPNEEWAFLRRPPTRDSSSSRLSCG